ncbi:4Fe-4S dicluster domain-containing protein [Gordonibacter sp. KGMB07426]|uniref:4Fe-4S dicluster domain-containing protein n=1 Tax=Gordonibacter TaxID=644652 RepID=UPI003B27DCC1
MAEEITRRGFLAAGAVGAALVGVGGFGAVTGQADQAFVRPPGTTSNVKLVAACNRCDRCLQACPYGIITPAPLSESIVAYGTPTLAFANGFCDFCMKCVDACPTGALSYGGEAERDLGVAVVVKDACVAWDWAGCTVCKDECPVEGAITLDDHDRPVVHPDFCDGCGKCEQVCPSASLRAYDASVAEKGIVVVSRASEAAQLLGAVMSAELEAGRTAPAAQPVAPHSKGIHPDGPDNTRSAEGKGALHENA